MNNGFIYLHRKIKDHWIWENPYYYQWFSYFLFRANFKDNKILIGAELIDIKKGEFITLIDKLTKDLNGAISQKVRTFLKLLEKDSMIIKKSTNKLTKITICNYDEYQTNQQTDNKPITNKKQTNNKQITTENKVNKVKKVNKVYKSKEEEIKETGIYQLKNFKHLSITKEDYQKLELKHKNELINSKLDAIDNNKNSKNYIDLNKTLQNWLKNDFNKTDNKKLQMDQSDFSTHDDGWDKT